MAVSASDSMGETISSSAIWSHRFGGLADLGMSSGRIMVGTLLDGTYVVLSKLTDR